LLFSAVVFTAVVDMFTDSRFLQLRDIYTQNIYFIRKRQYINKTDWTDDKSKVRLHYSAH